METLIKVNRNKVILMAKVNTLTLMVEFKKVNRLIMIFKVL